MIKYNEIKYESARQKIRTFIDDKRTLEEVITYFGDPDQLDISLGVLCKSEKICVTSEEWQDLVVLEFKANDEYTKRLKQEEFSGVIVRENEVNDFKIPTDPKSNWQTFKNDKLFKELKFKDETIQSIEKDTLEIIRSISTRNIDDKPVKGLVIGGVQSGKTTNMAALMAMGSDQGFNLFIILSGTIESLRIQTESRIRKLIDDTGRQRPWQLISRPKNGKNNRVSNFYSKNKNLYTVVLKNASRLRQLLDWLTSSPQYMENFKVIIIDDEADQGSVNTSKDPDRNRKTINKLIVNLVHGNEKNSEKAKGKYASVNYIGYTATPYANILSESPSQQSLYPQNFISILSKSNQHFGPKQIFGTHNFEDEELNIIRTIKNESAELKLFLSGTTKQLPNSFKESIAYFISAAASLRLHKFGKPVSMLVHMSNKIDIHNHIFSSVVNWLIEEQYEVLEIAEKVWSSEYKLLSVEELKTKVYIDELRTLKPHNFDEIKLIIQDLIKEIRPPKIEENGNLLFHDGIITSIDHSGNNYLETDDHARLLYPENKSDLERTPVFLVIGGATLSRGLTLEGLITSYFLRTPSAADTLTQMGRWFGYRINYELYPRIWLTPKTLDQFKFISKLELDLYDEIKTMIQQGTDFSKIGPRITHSPQYIDLTSSNKRRAMKQAEYDFTGFSSQTDKFDNDVDIQKSNIAVTETFINSLGKPNIIDETSSSKVYWDQIPFRDIKNNLLSKFKFNNRIKSLNNIPELISWIEKVTDSEKLEAWNVILAGRGKANHSETQRDSSWNLENVIFSKVNRSKKISSFEDEIDIGVLRNPSDLYADCDLSKIRDSDLKEEIKLPGKLGETVIYDRIRDDLGLKKTPQLIIYKIDKNSTAKTPNREKLGIESDIIGLYIQIPRGDKTEVYSTKVTVKIEDNHKNMLQDSDVFEEDIHA